MREYTVHVTIPEQAIEVNALALSRDDAKKTVLQQVTLTDLPNKCSIAVSEADDE